MSLRVTWDGALPAGEPMDVVMEDCTSWTPANTVLKAGRELSSWFFKRPSTQRRPSLFSLCSSPRETEFYDTDPPMDIDIPKQPLNINDLPQEVLEEIFIAYLNTPDPADSSTLYGGARYRVSSHLDSSSNPILLGQVCSTWRACTQSLPVLWRKILVFCPQPQDVALFTLWLERSGKMPLDLTLVNRFEITEDSTTAIREIFRLTLAQSSRWNAVTFDLATDMGDLVASHPLPGTLALRSFDVNIAHWSERSLQLLLNLLYSSSILRKVHYEMPSSNKSLSAIFQTPLHLRPNITHMEVGYIPTDGLVGLLGCYTSLEHLAFTAATPLLDQDYIHRPLVLPALQSLTIGHKSDVISLLGSFCLPSLKSLKLPNGFASTLSPQCRSADGWNALFNLIERSSPANPGVSVRLESLVLDLSGMDEESIVQGLRSPLLASLRSLYISSQISDPFIKALTRPSPCGNEDDGVSDLLPKLENLELRKCWTSGERLSDMILSRNPPLKSVRARMKGSCGLVEDLAILGPGVEITF